VRGTPPREVDVGRWTDRVRQWRRRLEALAQEVAGALAPSEPERVLVPVRARPLRDPRAPVEPG
jgi:hypothetical protein